MSITTISPMAAPPAPAASVLSAYSKFEALRLEYTAAQDRLNAATDEVGVEMGPPPSSDWSSPSKHAEWSWYWAQQNRRVTTRLGVADSDEFWHAYHDRMERAYEELTAIQATTIAELLCQVRAWWNVDDNVDETEVPAPDCTEGTYEAEEIVRRIYHDLERLAGEAPS